MEKNNYYEPKISDLHIGFEYKIYRSDDDGVYWEKLTIEDSSDLDEGLFATACHGTKVKYLNKKDIESLGWKLISDGKNDNIIEQKFEIDTYDHPWKWMLQLILPINKPFEINNVAIYFTNDKDEYVKFDGTIKNKSELKTLMKQIQCQ